MQREALRVGDDAGAGKGEQELLGLIELDAGIGEPGDGRREGVDRRLGKGHPVPARGVADPSSCLRLSRDGAIEAGEIEIGGEGVGHGDLRRQV